MPQSRKRNESGQMHESHRNRKNYQTDGTPKWSVEQVCFDQEGRLYVCDPNLALEVQKAINAWRGRFCIVRDLLPGEKRRMTDIPDYGKGNGETSTTTSYDPAGNKVNMMCPCTAG